MKRKFYVKCNRGYRAPINKCLIDFSQGMVQRPIKRSRTELPHRIDPVIEMQNQAKQAANEWGSSTKTFDKPYLKSWYYPLDAFDPWPKETSSRCWWCTLNYDWTPFPCPLRYDRISQRYKTIGMFCGPSCAKSYARHTGRFSNLGNILSFIDLIAWRFFGYTRGVITLPAPQKELLQMYCGSNGFSVEQYRNLIQTGKNIQILPPNWVTVKQIVQAEQDNAKSKKIFHSENPDNIQTTADLVKVKRIPYANSKKRLLDYFKK